jgi:hypothetical protein
MEQQFSYQSTGTADTGLICKNSAAAIKLSFYFTASNHCTWRFTILTSTNWSLASRAAACRGAYFKLN